MAECRGSGLGECRAERAARVHRPAGIDVALHPIGAGEVAEFVNDCTLLRSQQQQEETQCFVHISHWAQSRDIQSVTRKANRTDSKLQYLFLTVSNGPQSVGWPPGFAGTANPGKGAWMHIQFRSAPDRVSFHRPILRWLSGVGG